MGTADVSSVFCWQLNGQQLKFIKNKSNNETKNDKKNVQVQKTLINLSSTNRGGKIKSDS